METLLKGINRFSPSQEPGREEIFAKNVRELLDHFIEESQLFVGKPAAQMRRKEKVEMVRYLDEKGVFLITHSGERVCEVLNISKLHCTAIWTASANQAEAPTKRTK
jgi:predicted transcriptional regulator YheO